MDTERFRKRKPPVAEDQTVYSARAPIQLPLDLSQWVAPEKLLACIKEDMSKLDRAEPENAEFFRMLPEKRPQVLLSLLLYAYATQVFGSEEIVEACHQKPVFKEICEGVPPFMHELEQFRRKHRPLLEH